MNQHSASPGEISSACDRAPAGLVWGDLFDDADRMLLVDPAYKKFWNLPGGAVDAGESPRAACIREVREELGLFPPIGAPLMTAALPARAEGVPRYVELG
ncbi:NUDIX domain-containing protein [Actinoplanes sp. NPDC051859]|uniref:NUDIX domain-containing protein n=1 Tax=Actinoplanes sp. NPDC051859 TaxID=3363909 RepID=UPI003798EAC4